MSGDSKTVIDSISTPTRQAHVFESEDNIVYETWGGNDDDIGGRAVALSRDEAVRFANSLLRYCQENPR